jgi:chromosome partitioning protein
MTLKANPFVTAVANYKGGVGKSTVAVHLAAHLGASLIDLDQNGDSARFGLRAGLDTHRMHDASPEEVFDLVAQLRKDGRSVVLDCPPGSSYLTQVALLTCDAVLCPTRPGPNDVYAIGRVNLAVKDASSARQEPIPLLYICNFFRNTEVAKIFVGTLQSSDKGEYIGRMWERKEYAEAVEAGVPVWDFAPKSTGAEEMRNLVCFLEATRGSREKVRRHA